MGNDDGARVVYDVKEDIEAVADFEALRSECGLFAQAQVDASRTCVFWNERADLASDCIYEVWREGLKGGGVNAKGVRGISFAKKRGVGNEGESKGEVKEE